MVVVWILGALILAWRLVAVVRLGRHHAALDAAVVPVSIIVPARNEAGNLPALLDSLARLDPAPCEIIVVDDHSSDGTGDLARARGATVVVPEPLPPGWLGKPWACAAGAAVAHSELLLFTDADTVHAPDSLGRAVARRADLVSVLPTHRQVAFWERLQGAFHVLLLVATRAGSGGADRDFAIGQYLLFRRDAYLLLGGHALVKDRVAEDLAFARAVRRRGASYALLYAPGLLGVRMYPEGLGAFVAGWRRNFREGLAAAGVVGVVEVALVVAWLGGVLVHPYALLLTLVAVAAAQRLAGRFHPLSALAYPLALVVFVAVTLLAGWDRLRGAPITWRGRAVDLGRP